MPVMKTMYDRETNEAVTAYAVNTDAAVKKFPERWSYSPWAASDVGKAPAPQPPADNAHVAPGAEQFPDPKPAKPKKAATPEVDRAKMDALRAEYQKLKGAKAPGFLNTEAKLEGAIAKIKEKNSGGGAAT